MHFFFQSLHRPGRALLAAGLIGGATYGAASTDEAHFLAEARTAMAKMMATMEVKPSGDVDAAFVAMMVPHHQGAIEMAQAQLRYGHNEQLRRMAQEIIVTQRQEIAAMRSAIGHPLPPSTASPDQPSSTVSTTTHARSHHPMRSHLEP